MTQPIHARHPGPAPQAMPQQKAARDEPGDGKPFGNMLSTLLSSPPGVRTRAGGLDQPQADRFNEDGFFQGAVNMGAAPGRAAGHVAGTGIAEAPIDAEPASTGSRKPGVPLHLAAQAYREPADVPELGTRAWRSPLDGATAANSAANKPMPAPVRSSSPMAARLVGRAIDVAAARIEARVEHLPIPGERGGGAATSRAQRRLAEMVQDHLRKAGATEARVAVRGTEQGLRVVARVENLDRLQRAELLDRIGELLSEYGFPAADVRLNGQSAPARRS